jgi:hypothetical protein
MAVTVTASHFVCGSAENDASLKAAIDANPSLGMYESGAAVFRSRSLSIPSGTSLTLNDYTNLVFDDAAGYRIDLAGKLDFKFGGGITYNGDVQHTFLNGELHGENITYTLNGNVANGRSDFFSPNTSSASTLKNLRLVYGKGAAGYNYYTHLEPLAGRIDGLTLINNLQVASTIYVQFGNGTYSGVALPKLVSNFGVTAALSVYLARSGGNSRLPKINITGQSLTIVGDTLGAAELIDESWPDIGNGQYGTIAPGLQNVNNTTVARKLTFIPGSLFDAADNIFVRITDSRATPGVYLDGAIASASGTEIQWASYSRNPNLQTDFGAINLVARRWDMVEQVRTYNITKTANGSVFKWASDFGQTPFTYSALNVVDTYATSKRTALVGIAFDAVAKTVTFSQAMTWDDAHDFAKFYLTQNRDVTNFLSPSGTTWVLTGGWSVINQSIVSAGPKLKGLVDANSSGAIGVRLTSLTDTVQMRKASDNSLIATRTGAGGFSVSPANVGVSVYFERKTGANLVMSTITTPVTLTAGVNPDVPLYAGAEVQVAQAGRIELLPTLSEMTSGGIALQSTLTTLASTNQTEHDATQQLIAALPAPLNSTQIQAAAAAALTAYDAVVPADLAGLALEASVQTRATQTSVDAIPTNPLLTTDTRLNNLDAAISTRLAASAYTAPTTAPTAAQIRAEMETVGGKLDTALKTAKKVRIQTL